MKDFHGSLSERTLTVSLDRIETLNCVHHEYGPAGCSNMVYCSLIPRPFVRGGEKGPVSTVYTCVPFPYMHGQLDTLGIYSYTVGINKKFPHPFRAMERSSHSIPVQSLFNSRATSVPVRFNEMTIPVLRPFFARSVRSLTQLVIEPTMRCLRRIQGHAPLR